MSKRARLVELVCLTASGSILALLAVPFGHFSLGHGHPDLQWAVPTAFELRLDKTLDKVMAPHGIQGWFESYIDGKFIGPGLAHMEHSEDMFFLEALFEFSTDGACLFPEAFFQPEIHILEQQLRELLFQFPKLF